MASQPSNSIVPVDRPECNSPGQSDRPGMTILAVFPVIPVRKHGTPCICAWGFPPTRERYNSVRAEHNLTWYSRTYGTQETLPAWQSDNAYPPICDRIAYERRVYAVCTCGELIAAKFSAYHGTVSSDHRCEAVA